MTEPTRTGESALSQSNAENLRGTVLFDADAYPEDHSPFCPRECDHPCHDAYDQEHR